MSPRKLQPALLAGVFIGAFSALPVVSVGNLCCCLWLVSGGVLAAWLMQQSHPAPVSPFDGATVGLLAGLVGALAYVVIAWPVTLVVGPMMEEWLQRVVEGAGDVPWRDVLERYQGRGALAVSLIVGFLLQLVFGAIFATLGGVLGAMLFKKAPPLPPPPSFEPPAGPWTPPPPLPGPQP